MSLNFFKHHSLLLTSTALICLILLSGCQLLPPYRSPITPTPYHWKRTYDAPDAGQSVIPPTWKEETSTLSNPQSENSEKETPPPEQTPELRLEDVRRGLCDWWGIFQDPVLNELEEHALNSSYNLWAALERVIQAREIAQINFAPLLPGINFTPSFTRTGLLFQNPLPSTGTGSGSGANQTSTSSGMTSSLPTTTTTTAATTPAASPLTTLPKDFRFVESEYLFPLNLSYEVDLWCKLHNAYQAAVNRSQASYQEYLNVLLSLTSDIAAAYFQLRGLDAQQEVILRNIRVRQNAVDINRARFNAGLIVYLDVSRAEVELARAHSDLDNVQRLRGLQENIIATLVGVPPSIFSVKYDPVMIPPPVIPTGLPSELLCRRPDVAEAERYLAAAYQDIGVAYANFFPSLKLNASFGFESPFAHELFTWKARFWSVALNVMQTVFDAGRNQANYDYYQSRFREAMANYQQQVLQAFKDVEDALVNLRQYAKQNQDLAIAIKAARLTLELAQLRYNRGLINYLDVVDAERQLLETEQNAVIVLGNRYVSTVMLIRALGGGWGPCEGCAEQYE